MQLTARNVCAEAACVEILERRVLLSSYFVSGALGADGNVGSLAQPFQTIQRAADVAQPGDTVYVRAGVYHETIAPAHSGTASAPILFQPYNGETVTIDGADPITGWSSAGGSIYQAAQPWDLGDGSNQVFIDGQMITEARWPNTSLDLSHPTVARADNMVVHANSSGYSTAELRDASLTQPAGTWDGATIHIAAGQGWVFQTGTVINSSPGRLTFRYQQLSSYQVPHAGDPFYLTGKFQGLDAPAEWYRDPTSGQLYFWAPGSDSPASHNVEAKHRLYAFDLSGLSYVTVEGFHLFASTINTDARSANLVLSALDAQYISHSTLSEIPWSIKNQPHTTGIILNGRNNLLKDSTIAFSSGDGVFLGGSSNTVQNCTIHDVDYAAGDEGGVSLLGSDEQILHNTIYNAGRNGIVDYFCPRINILNNIIHDVMLQTTDGGGVYAFHTDGQGTEIAYNQVYNVRTGGYGGVGLYLDNNSSNFILHHNVVWNADHALKMNPTNRNNQIYNNTLVGVHDSLATSGDADMVGSVFCNNIFVGPTTFGPGCVHSHNIFDNAGFVNPSAADFTLKPNSRAVDRGISNTYTGDYMGNSPDAGAYECGMTPFSAGAVKVVPAPESDTQSAFSAIEAERFNAASGTTLRAPGVGSLDRGDWLQFDRIDFGSGVSSIQASVAVTDAWAGGPLEFRLDSPDGFLIATLNLTSTGSWNAYAVQQTITQRAVGIHTLFVISRRQAVANLDWFQFS